MKILYLTTNREGLVSLDRFHQLEKAVGRLAECRWAGPGHGDHLDEPIDETVRRLYGGDSPDWVIVEEWHYWDKVKSLKRRDYKIAAYMSDIHCTWRHGLPPPDIVKRMNEVGFDAVLMEYLKLAYQEIPFKPISPSFYLDNLKPKICHMSPCVNPDIYKPTDKPKIYDVVFLGAAVPHFYPIRHDILKKLPQLAEDKGWNVLIRRRPPGESKDRKIGDLLLKGHVVGEKYVETLGRSKIFIFGSSIYKYPLLKYFEGMACKTLVVADKPFTAEALHLVPNLNFVEISLQDWAGKLEYYLRHDEEREKIAEEGYRTAMRYHTCGERARTLVRFLEENR